MADFYHKRNHMPMSRWIDAEGGYVPYGESFAGGMDVNSETLYVGRALHNGECLPGKVVPSHGVCYVANDGKEYPHRVYQVLCSNDMNYFWLPGAEGSIPNEAVVGGKTRDGEKLYIGRAFFRGSLCVGKVQSSSGHLFIPYAGGEHACKEYEVLCVKT